MNQGDRVRIVKMSARPRAKVGASNPRIGDVGTVRFAVKNRLQEPCAYWVACARPDGTAAWVADFTADEVEVAEAPSERVALIENALADAKNLIAAAKANGHIRGIGDTKFCWLSADRADAHADLLRAAGLAFIHIDRVDKTPVEHFQPVCDDAFWAKLDPVRNDRRFAKLFFRISER